MTLIKGLSLNKVDVTELNEPLWDGKTHKSGFTLFGYIKLALRYLYCYLTLFFKGMVVETDCFIVGYPGHFDVFLARIVSTLRRKPLVFDAFLSLYDSMVCDRGVMSRKSISARLLHFVDATACKMSDRVLLDTDAHIDYFCREFNVSKNKFVRIWIGCDSEVFAPKEVVKCEKFTVCFHGKFIPLQGVQYILQAAKILENENVFFRIIGEGQTFPELKQYVDDEQIENVKFYGMLPMSDIPQLQLESHVGLGIFGDTDKAKRVIPNKLYEIMALKMPVITGESVAVAELFTDGEELFTCNMADAESLADRIRTLRDNRGQLSDVALKGYQKYQDTCTPTELGKTLASALDDLIRQR
ncbi:MAG: glycosyltransferase [Halioglobus sp.]